jgi:hypothetical protein
MTPYRAVLVARALVGPLALLFAGGIGSAAGTAAPSSFQLVLDGKHQPAVDSPVGFWHVGEFTASTPFCSSGSATTLGVTGTSPADAQATRLLTCADGRGSATALVISVDSEHGGAGEWRVVAGTGPYTRLRGRGTFRSARTGGDPGDHGSITFRSSWTGIADYDNTPPTISISRARVTKLRRLSGSYLLRVAFSAQEASGAVRYRIAVSCKGTFLASRVGETLSGKASAAIRMRVAKGVRRLRVEITASDALGNESKLSRDVVLPR